MSSTKAMVLFFSGKGCKWKDKRVAAIQGPKCGNCRVLQSNACCQRQHLIVVCWGVQTAHTMYLNGAGDLSEDI